jgi:S-methylmethionine-dependent homocysteine/selenocysteine methylase
MKKERNMEKYRSSLPQLGNATFLTDGGLETTLIFHQGIELPCFAAFDLLKNEAGKQMLKNYFEQYLQVARQYRAAGFILESPTWRANQAWGEKLGYTAAALDQVNRTAIEQLEGLREAWETEDFRVVISGNIGPRGDGYAPSHIMNAQQAEAYHAPQIETFSRTSADLVSAFTLNYTAEAIGIVRAARSFKMPVVISFTVETDGNLPSGELLQAAITEVDRLTQGYAAYFMINCAHPSHFQQVLQAGTDWVKRIRGIRANASSCSHQELDEADHLDPGDKDVLAMGYRQLRSLLPNLNIIGGCCGTDHTHLEKICARWFDEKVLQQERP